MEQTHLQHPIFQSRVLFVCAPRYRTAVSTSGVLNIDYKRRREDISITCNRKMGVGAEWFMEEWHQHERGAKEKRRLKREEEEVEARAGAVAEGPDRKRTGEENI